MVYHKKHPPPCTSRSPSIHFLQERDRKGGRLIQLIDNIKFRWQWYHFYNFKSSYYVIWAPITIERALLLRDPETDLCSLLLQSGCSLDISSPLLNLRALVCLWCRALSARSYTTFRSLIMAFILEKYTFWCHSHTSQRLKGSSMIFGDSLGQSVL